MRQLANRHRWRGLAWGLTLAALLTGCNLVEIGYHQLDWIMLKRIERLVYLETDQRQQLEQDIHALLDWHCRTQLPAYVGFLDDLRRDFNTGAITPARVATYSDRLEDFWYALLERSSIGASRLLASLSERQLSEIDRVLGERNQKNAHQVRAAARDDDAQDYAKLAERHWRRWLGPLNDRQQQLIGDWSRAFQPLDRVGVDFRHQLHHQLLALATEHRSDPAGMSEAIQRFITAIREAPPSDYATRIDANKRISIEMVAAVAAAAEPDQVQHLMRVAGRRRSDLIGIECR